jgi:hypothetical protein
MGGLLPGVTRRRDEQMEHGWAPPLLGHSGAHHGARRRRHPEWRAEVGDVVIAATIPYSRSELAAEEDVLALLQLFLVRAGMIYAFFVAPCRALHRSQARGEGGAGVRDAVCQSEARWQQRYVWNGEKLYEDIFSNLF